MLGSLIKVIQGNSKQQEKKVKPQADNKAMRSSGAPSSFAGLTPIQMKRELEMAATGRAGNLAPPKLSEDAKKSLENSELKKDIPINISSSSSFGEIVATIFSEGDTTEAINRLKRHINENKGEVEPKIWYMLMDAYQINNDKESFEKAAYSFSSCFGTSPPSWGEDERKNQKGLLAGKNIMILETQFKEEYTAKFKEFLKAAKEVQFCRINVSPCKFEQSDYSALVLFHKLLINLRKSRVMGVLMGDNNLINFCKTYINPNESNSHLKTEFLNNESFFWLLYLEILQWKGKNEEYENFALQYAVKFEMSPPDWDEHGVMVLEKIQDEDTSTILEKVINSNNIQSLLDIIKEDFSKSNKSELDLSDVDRIDFASAGAISHYIQELSGDPENDNKEVVFKFPNEMVLTLLEMIGVNEFVTILPKHR